MARRSFLHASAGLAAAWAFGASARAQETLRHALSEGAPSATAARAALHRALHQIVDHPRVLDDALALRILDAAERERLQALADSGSRGMRAFIALRSRYAEDRLAAAFGRGARQYVVLGAGLDTFALRNSFAANGLEVFEVDHPATQRWKRTRLHAAGIEVPAAVRFVPVDFETQRLADRLRDAGFRFDRPALFSLLGVVVYLTEAAVMETLRVIAGGAAGTEVVFDFGLPVEVLNASQRARREAAMARMAQLGEPWLSFFHPDSLRSLMREAGFGEVEILTPQAANQLYFAHRADGLRTGSGHMAAGRV